MTASVSKQRIRAIMQEFDRSTRYKVARNAATRSELKNISMNWDRYAKMNHHFSHSVTNELPVTNQKVSGRCWLFAALNLLRVKIARKYKLEKFELSQSYLYFWDKFEKANFFLESIMATSEQAYESRIVMHLLAAPMQDGGQWHMFTNLVEKYGVVPQEVYPDSEACKNSTEMCYTLTLKLRENANTLRKLIDEGKNKRALQKVKEEMMEEIYRILAIHMGTPPTSFDWEFQDKNKKFHAYRNLTPHIFFEKHVPCNLDDYICLVHSPRKQLTPFNKTYTIQYLGNVVEGKPIKYVNVKMETFKKATVKSLLGNEPVWFGCDVGKRFHREIGIMDLKLYDYDLLYDVQFKMNKEIRMRSGESMMTHAMLFTGVNLIDEKPVKWKVENSWGDQKGNKGYYIMTDDWFEEYMFEVAIEKKYLPKDVKEVEKLKPIALDPWDPLGALA